MKVIDSSFYFFVLRESFICGSERWMRYLVGS